MTDDLSAAGGATFDPDWAVDDALLDFSDTATDPLAQALSGFKAAVTDAGAVRLAAMAPIDVAALAAASHAELADPAAPSAPAQGPTGVAGWVPPAIVGAVVVGVVAALVALVSILSPSPVSAPPPAVVPPATSAPVSQPTASPPPTATAATSTAASAPATSVAATQGVPAPATDPKEGITARPVPAPTTRPAAPPETTQPPTTRPVTTQPVTTQPTQPTATVTQPTATVTPPSSSASVPYYNSVRVQITLAFGLMNPAGRLPTATELLSAQSHLDQAQSLLEIRRSQEGCQNPLSTSCSPAALAALTAAQNDIDAARATLAQRWLDIGGPPSPTASAKTLPSGSVSPGGPPASQPS